MITIDYPDPGIARLTLDRPEQRNALSTALLEALHAAIHELSPRCGPAPVDAGRSDPASDGERGGERIRVLILTGTGKAFCAGMDLREVLVDPDFHGSADDEAPGRLLASLAELTLRLRMLDAVTIASVNGAAIGGGCGLACCCDVLVTHAQARLGFPEVSLGICPAVVAPWLIRKIGPGPARVALLTGRLMDGAEAHALGLADHLAPDAAELEAMTLGIARLVSAAGVNALAQTRRLLHRLESAEQLEAEVRSGAQLSASVLVGREAQERLGALARPAPTDGR